LNNEVVGIAADARQTQHPSLEVLGPFNLRSSQNTVRQAVLSAVRCDLYMAQRYIGTTDLVKKSFAYPLLRSSTSIAGDKRQTHPGRPEFILSVTKPSFCRPPKLIRAVA
jgi:hypothetical protein